MNFLIAPLFGALHITTALGVHIAPGLVKVRTHALYLSVLLAWMFGNIYADSMACPSISLHLCTSHCLSSL